MYTYICISIQTCIQAYPIWTLCDSVRTPETAYVGPREDALAAFLASLVLPFVLGAIGPLLHALAVLLVL